jgi:hypothetical protein
MLTIEASMHNTASMVAWAESPFIGVSFNYRYETPTLLTHSNYSRQKELAL